MQSVRDIYCTFTEGLHDGCTERGTYARHNGKAAARGAQCGAAVAGRGSAGRRGAGGRAGLRRGCAVWAGAGHRLPAVLLPGRGAGHAGGGAGVPADAAGRQAGRGCRGCRGGAAAHRWPPRGRGAGGLPDADGGAGAANRTGGGTFQPGADRHGGVYGAAGRGFWLGVRAFSGAGAARRLPVAGCGYGMPAALCRRALGSGPGAGRGGRAVCGHRRHAGADRRAEHCAGGGHHGVGADTGLRRAGCGAGQSGGILPLPGGAGPLRRSVCGGLHRGGTGRARRCQCAAAGGQCRGGRCGCAGCAGERAAQNFPAARAARADAGPGRGGAQALRRGGHAERHCRHGQRGLPAAAAAQGRDL